ncbi:hypothetical protein SEA_SHROOMS_49 [Arthrobacter phage Shrooms]|nr:hypothetical protein SEA_SHROOMS_49 [Arthrobacter phage Shrooms]
MTGHQLIAALQRLDEAALNLPVKVPYHELYDSDISMEEAVSVTLATGGDYYSRDKGPAIYIEARQ